MPKALVRPEQASYPLPVATGRDATALWLENPIMSLVVWRDYRLSTRAYGVGSNNLIERCQTFDEVFAQGTADAIVGAVIIVVEVGHA